MTVSIRRAINNDVGQLVLLCEALHAESPNYSLQPFDGETLAQKIVNGMSIDNNIVFIAEDDGCAIGYFMGGYMESFINSQRTAFDYSFYVLPNKRNGRTAIKLFNAFEDWAKSKDCSLIQIGITTDINTEKTSKFYSILGFKPHAVTFEKGL